jgi:nucleoside-diphosphate-sugar epimerase
MNERTTTVWLAGATGMVGRALTVQLLEQAGVELHLLLRRAAPASLPSSPRLHVHQIDFSRADLGRAELPAPEQVFIALGRTIAAERVARAMRLAVAQDEGAVCVLESAQMQVLGTP